MFSSLVQVERHADGIYSAPESPDKGERMFGGQFLAQCLAAAQAEMDADRGVHSLHGYFLRPGDVHLPLLLRVETVRDGRSFSSRQVTAEQRGKELFRLLASFKTPDETPEFAAFPMPEAPPADSVAKTYDAFTREMSGEEYWAGNARHMDIRYVNPPTAPRGVPVTEPQLTWMRIKDPLPEDADVHWAGIAYLSDSTLVDPIVLPHGMRWQDPDFGGTSLDHAMWFHRLARADEWLLFVQTVEATGSGRGLASGRIYTESGELVATCMQEGLMRWSAPGATTAV